MKAFLSIVAILLVFAGSAPAEECEIGVFADPEGTQSLFYPPELENFSVYVVMFVEDTVAAAAYHLMMGPEDPAGPFLVGRSTGPSGRGLHIDEPTGTNSALAECVIGFGARPVVVDEYVFVVVRGHGGLLNFWIEPNVNQDPDFPIYVTCNDIIRECDVGSDLRIPLSSEARSFSTIKSLYHKD